MKLKAFWDQLVGVLLMIPKAKVTGGELDTSLPIRQLGLALLGSPARKRLALSGITPELLQLGVTTDVLHACLLGGAVGHSCLSLPKATICVLRIR